MKIRQHISLAFGLAALLSTQSFGQNTFDGPRTSLQNYNGNIKIDNAQIVSVHKIQVAAQADGLISELLADEGRTVKKGDTLLIIDDRVARAEVAVATKEYEAAKKQAEQTADIEYAKKASEVSDAEYADIFRLYNQGSATYSEARRKQLEKERARLGIDVADVKHQQEILTAEVNNEKVKASQVRLDLYKVLAPYDGVIVQRLRDQGEWIRAGEPILRLVHMNEMKVEAFVPTEGINVVQLEGAAMKIAVRISAENVANYDTKVEYASPEIESRNIRISTRIQNQMVGGGWLLRDGMIASIEITLAQ